MNCIIAECSSAALKRGMCNMHYLRWWKYGDALFVPIQSFRRPAIDRLLAHAVRIEPKPGQIVGCLEWRGSTRSGTDGVYGLMQFEGKPQLVHRVSYQLANGSIEDGMLVCHSCDNPPCIEPTHLFAGTPTDNMRDMRSKGRDRWSKRRANGGRVNI